MYKQDSNKLSHATKTTTTTVSHKTAMVGGYRSSTGRQATQPTPSCCYYMDFLPHLISTVTLYLRLPIASILSPQITQDSVTPTCQIVQNLSTRSTG